MTKQQYRSLLGLARRDGSAKQGSHHWNLQRITSVALFFLGLWFFYGLIVHDVSSHQSAVAWFQNPVSFSLMILTVLVGMYHAILGLQVVIEDYVHRESVMFIVLILIRFIFAFLAIAAIYSLIKIQSIAQGPTAELLV